MFCRCFSRAFLSRLRVCKDAEDRAEFILAVVTAEVAVAVLAAAAAERFLFKRLRLNRRELLLEEPRPLDAFTARFDALERLEPTVEAE